ncbi:MAG TPA: energy transducer TonB [Steroidobacteraceae bacterium]|jgi:TonB family protein
MTSERTQDWVDGIVHQLIRRAAKHAPDSLADRLEEEWLADMSERRGSLARLRFGIGCCWATNVIAREHVAAAPLAATVSPTPHRYFIRMREADSPFFTGRTITFMLVVSLHLAVLYGLAIGLGPTFIRTIAGPFESREIPPAPRINPPPLPLPNIPTRIDLPTSHDMSPLEPVQRDVMTGTPNEATPSEPAVAGLPQPQPIPVRRVEGGPGVGFPSTRDFYPDASIRREEQGIATVRACVDAKGRLISEPTMIQSAGFRRLDEAAVRLATAGSGRYRASTEDGKPVDSCYSLRIRFQLRN